MINVSSAYKKAMNNQIRDRAYISVGIGVINQNAQEDSTANGVFSYYSQGDIFDTNQAKIDYATMEENYFKLDGSMLFVPENNELMQLKNNGITLEEYLAPIRIDFSKFYAIKGLTIDFGFSYPSEFSIRTAQKEFTYTNNSQKFMTEDVMGDTDHIIITPITMTGGKQRLRIKSILMGIGLAYSNKQTKSFSLKESVSSISDELPSETLNFAFYDEEGRFDVDDENSFIDYLETMQRITVSFGITLENGTVEWNQIATLYLKNWKSQKGQVTMTATDRLAQMEDEYSLGDKIYERTAYSEAESIFADAGLEPDEYFIDEYLNDVVLNNPMPVGTHKSCLQLLANACRCIIRQDENGKIMIKANFANVLDPDDLNVETNGVAKWSKIQNVLHGSEVVYAELTQDFIKTDGSMYFLPEDSSYLETSYVSEQVADCNGKFNKNLLKNNAQIKTAYGITFTVNDDGSVIANGTVTKTPDTITICKDLSFLEKGEKYIITGVPNTSNCAIKIADDTGKSIVEITNNTPIKEFTYDEKMSDVQLVVRNVGTTVKNLIFSPMIRLAEDTDDAYQPYQENPTITITMPAAYSYFGLSMKFDGNPPQEMIIHTYNADTLKESTVFTDMTQETALYHEFLQFDKMVIEFTKGYPNNRVLVNKITFGDLSDYVLTRNLMMENPIGYKEKRVKAVKVKIFSYQNDEEGNPEEIEDNIFATRILNEVGEIRTLANPLVSTEEHAELLAEWIGNYYANNISYDVKYRGEPRINAADIIHMESEKLSNLQVEITNHTLNFNGAFNGSLELRRALKMMGD